MPANRRLAKNISRSKPITSKEAIARANQQIWLGKFNPDYDQVMLRISTAANNGLRNGAPPPIVT